MDPIKIGEQEYTIEQLQEIVTKHPELEKSYKKLEGEFTKTKQSHKELETQSAQLKQFADEWGEFAQNVTNNPTLAGELVKVYQNFQQGTLTKQDTNTLQTAIKSAKQDGDSDAVKELREQFEAVQSALAEQEIEKTFGSLEERAEKDGLEDFTIDGFKKFAETWLEEEEGIGEDDEVTPKHIRQAYTAYKAQLLEETIKSGKIPHLGSNGGGTPDAKPPKDAPKGLAARIAQAQGYLDRLK